ncbi:sec-independent protein translocase protein TatC [Propionibacterium cyclohexanicum]|uniref:Sec-independent protein translocase protein TatC n=2 Tax=Propionibacterium cyclohexanicum TaxID=64702 RepID=A0A1H9QTH7_9ACTN|nr:twin-arginine translocase subunit TatC [Propionibacterium cyclohexanicum]SER63687.1 sec-independent protein translocase protein TatC [Propionibacterium cyclohexanicum]
MATTVNGETPTPGPAKHHRRRLHILPAMLRPPEIGEDGSMELIDHLRELRYRVIVSMVAVLMVALVCFIFFNQLMAIAFAPIEQAIAMYKATSPGAQVEITTANLTGGFSLFMKVPIIAGFILSCPIWLYQVWAFIAPGLIATEKRAAMRFLLSAIPLFLAGVLLGYWIAPKGFAVLLQFNPPGVLNLNDANQFLTFELTLLLVFGVSFLLPVVLVTLNSFGIVTGAGLAKFRTVAIFLCFLFAAVATPSTDPISMSVLAIPMSLLYVIAEIICRRADKRRAAARETDD